MSEKKKPDWSVALVAETEDGKGRWTNIGVGYNNPKSETITILTDLFGGNKIVLRKPFEPKDKEEGREFNPFSK